MTEPASGDADVPQPPQPAAGEGTARPAPALPNRDLFSARNAVVTGFGYAAFFGLLLTLWTVISHGWHADLTASHVVLPGGVALLRFLFVVCFYRARIRYGQISGGVIAGAVLLVGSAMLAFALIAGNDLVLRPDAAMGWFLLVPVGYGLLAMGLHRVWPVAEPTSSSAPTRPVDPLTDDEWFARARQVLRDRGAHSDRRIEELLSEAGDRVAASGRSAQKELGGPVAWARSRRAEPGRREFYRMIPVLVIALGWGVQWVSGLVGAAGKVEAEDVFAGCGVLFLAWYSWSLWRTWRLAKAGERHA